MEETLQDVDKCHIKLQRPTCKPGVKRDMARQKQDGGSHKNLSGRKRGTLNYALSLGLEDSSILECDTVSSGTKLLTVEGRSTGSLLLSCFVFHSFVWASFVDKSGADL